VIKLKMRNFLQRKEHLLHFMLKMHHPLRFAVH